MYYSVYYINFLSVFKKKETEKTIKGNKEKGLVIHVQTGSHIIASEICHCLIY